MTAPAEPPGEHSLLIEPVWTPGRDSAFWSLLRRLRRLPRDYPVQHEPFRFDLRVTNNARVTSPSCVITEVSISEPGLRSPMLMFRGPFTVRSLDPGDAETISVGFFGTFLSGAVFVDCAIAAKDPECLIRGAVRDRATGETAESSMVNHW